MVMDAGVGGVVGAAEAAAPDGGETPRVRVLMPTLLGNDHSRTNTRPAEPITTGSEATIKRWQERAQAYPLHNVLVYSRLIDYPLQSSNDEPKICTESRSRNLWKSHKPDFISLEVIHILYLSSPNCIANKF